MAANPICPKCRKFGHNYVGIISLEVLGKPKQLMSMLCQGCGHKYLLPVTMWA